MVYTRINDHPSAITQGILWQEFHGHSQSRAPSRSGSAMCLTGDRYYHSLAAASTHPVDLPASIWRRLTPRPNSIHFREISQLSEPHVAYVELLYQAVCSQFGSMVHMSRPAQNSFPRRSLVRRERVGILSGPSETRSARLTAPGRFHYAGGEGRFVVSLPTGL